MKTITKEKINTPTAIFIDGSWLYATTKRIGKDVDYAKLFDILRKKFGTKVKIYYYGTIDSSNKQQQKFYLVLQKIGYIVYRTEIRKVGDRIIAGGMDINLVVNAMRILPLLKNFILISGDSDFAPLLQYARQIEVNTYVIAIPISTGYLLRKAVNTFINLETLLVERKIKISNKELKIQGFKDQNYIEKGDSFKSYIKLRDLMKVARKSIVVIDQYIDDQILLMFQPLEPKINKVIITDKKKIAPADFFIQVQKLEKDGHIIKIYDDKKFHDRFIGIDDSWWHSGHSFKNLGEKNSMLNKITEKAAKKINDEVAKIIDNSKRGVIQEKESDFGLK